MFTNISWTDYFITVTILLAIYYLFVGIRYYAGDIKDLLSGKRKLNLNTALSYNSKGEYPSTIEGNSHPSEASFEEKTDEELLTETIFIDFGNAVWAAILIDVVLQLNYHSIHHRAQIQAMIRQQGIEPDFLDYIGTKVRKIS